VTQDFYDFWLARATSACFVEPFGPYIFTTSFTEVTGGTTRVETSSRCAETAMKEYTGVKELLSSSTYAVIAPMFSPIFVSD
jgi:hypothetical protein